MPNLENLRKQAKQYLRWHRERRFTVAAPLRTLPKFAALTDAEIMAQPLRLADAQVLVARRRGYSSWQALKEGLQPMTDPIPPAYPSRPVILAVEPQVFVTDLPRALDFFTQTLGFTVGFTYGEPPFYAQVVRDAAMLNLRHVDRPVIRRDEPNLLSAAFTVSNARQLFQEFQSRGAPFRQGLTREPWHGQGQGNFIVEDPDGNLLMFGGRTD